jgi:hypothetical protein
MIGHHNFKDRVLIKRWWATHKINKMGKNLMDEKKGNRWKSFSVVVGGRVFSQNYNVHTRMNVENTIKKLQRIAREKEAQRFEHRQREEAKGKTLKKKRKHVEKKGEC